MTRKIAPEPIDGQPLARPRGSFERLADGFNNRIAQPALAQMSSPAKNAKNAVSIATGPGIFAGFLLNMMAIYGVVKFYEIINRKEVKSLGISTFVPGLIGADAFTGFCESLVDLGRKKLVDEPGGAFAEGFAKYIQEVMRNDAYPQPNPRDVEAINLLQAARAKEDLLGG